MSMPTKEMNEMIGMTLERLKAARKELAYVNAKADHIAIKLETIRRVILGEVGGDCMSGFFMVDVDDGKKQVDYPTIQDMNDILLNRENLTKEITELEKRGQTNGL